MPGKLPQLCLSMVLAVLAASANDQGSAAGAPSGLEKAAVTSDRAGPAKKVTVYVVPVRDQIAQPVLYILRRGLKEAERKAEVVVLDMETPGGALDVTFEIMEALGKFSGQTITYVNKEAVSAGAFISATTQEIWFAPDGVIGAAAPVMATGKEIDETMKLKVVSYLKARVRAISEGKGYRGQVISAMIDKDYELKIGDIVIKPKGELLSLTATEAAKTYGEPPQPLLAAGIAKNVDELLGKKFGPDGYQVVRLEVTWSERLAVWLNAISPVLLGLGLVALFIEFKTPGFGFFGIAGIALLAIVFLGSYVAGFSGHEPILIFAIGLVLVGVEIFVVPGVAILAVTGVVLMLGSLVWSMADLWPNEPITFSSEVFARPLQNVGLGLVIAVVLGLLLLRYMPRGWFWDKLILGTAVTSAAQKAGTAADTADQLDAIIGRRGIAATALRPTGQVEIEGRRYEAKVEVGAIDAGAPIVVCGRTDFGLVVEKADA